MHTVVGIREQHRRADATVHFLPPKQSQPDSGAVRLFDSSRAWTRANPAAADRCNVTFV